jgi:hypothetical protein
VDKHSGQREGRNIYHPMRFFDTEPTHCVLPVEPGLGSVIRNQTTLLCQVWRIEWMDLVSYSYRVCAVIKKGAAIQAETLPDLRSLRERAGAVPSALARIDHALLSETDPGILNRHAMGGPIRGDHEASPCQRPGRDRVRSAAGGSGLTRA